MNCNTINSIALFCGASSGNTSKYVEIAAQFGAECARRGWLLYYGGARLGLMYAAAQGAISMGGKVIGVTPSFFSDVEVQADNLTEMIVVDSMSERKQLLERRADAFVTLPGAFGTMDEFFEILTDAELGLHNKPVAILNSFGFYDSLLAQLKRFREEGFLKPCHLDLLIVAETLDELFEKLKNYKNTNDADWLRKIKN
ncbi:MAG: TIGR00730 family Rossman fold protein [Bacteroidales bacterium]|nr:TIGR00730 family Rossman fold protein [Bacteroidales bacterium]